MEYRRGVCKRNAGGGGPRCHLLSSGLLTVLGLALSSTYNWPPCCDVRTKCAIPTFGININILSCSCENDCVINLRGILVYAGIKQKTAFQFCPSYPLDSLQEFPCESKLNPENNPDMRAYIEENLGGLTLDEVILLYSNF